MKINSKIVHLSIKILVICLIGLLYFGRAFNKIQPYPCGDGVEYVITTEALFNHFSPEIKPSDFSSFQNTIQKKTKWVKEFGYKSDDFDKLKACIEYNLKSETKNNCGGFFYDKKGRYYGFHFFFYSLLNVPGRLISNLVDGNPLRTFQVTNAFFVIITICFLMFFTPFNIWFSIFSSIIFCFSSTYWYLGWPHPEILTTCLVTLGAFFFFQRKLFTGIFLIAFASLQNQPLFILLIFMGLSILYLEGFRKNVLIKLGIAGIIAAWPSLFYYIHFHSINLIKDAGFLKTNVITSLRVFGFYFDLNQGLILSAPLILPLYIMLIVKKTILTASRKIRFDPGITLPVFLIVMSCISSSMINWNHGQSVINRYATYFSGIIIIHSLFLLIEEKNNILKHVLFHYILISQIVTVLYHEKFDYLDFLSNEHKPIAKYVLNHYPSFYDPDPDIFIRRTLGPFAADIKESPVIYTDGEDKITKILVNKNEMDSLKFMGFNPTEIEKIKKKICFYNNWGYMNQGKYDLNKNPAYFAEIKHRRKLIILRSTIDMIKSNPQWLEVEKKKALDGNITLDKMLEIDADYVYNEAQKSNKK